MDKPGGWECVAWTWGIALLVGVFAACALWVLGGWSFMQGAFMGVLVLLILGAVLTIALCRGASAPLDAAGSGAAQATTAPAEGASAPAPSSPAPAPAPAPTPAAEARAPEPDPAPAPAPEPEPAPVAAAAAGPGTRPAALSAARESGPDDLKRIKGIGPKLEKLCNSLGFYHYDQIANWTAEEVAWVDDNLEGFKGRVSRDDWVAQARRLAAGEGG